MGEMADYALQDVATMHDLRERHVGGEFTLQESFDHGFLDASGTEQYLDNAYETAVTPWDLNSQLTTETLKFDNACLRQQEDNKMGEMADMLIDNMLGEDPYFGDQDEGNGQRSFDPLRYYTHVRFIRVIRQTKKAVRFEFEPGVEGWMPKGVIKDFKLEKQSMHVQKDFWKTKREELGIKRGGGLTDEKQGELKMVANNRKTIDAIMTEGQQEKFEFVDLQGKP